MRTDQLVTVPLAALDALELELRQLGGVALVTFSERDGEVLVELAAEAPFDLDLLMAEAQRIAHGHLEGPVSVSVLNRTADADLRADVRVRFVHSQAVGDEHLAEIHLALGDRRVATLTSTDDRLAVAEAALAALGELGFAVPFVAVAAHAVASELGAGCLVLLRHAATGHLRRGLASGSSAAESTTRAVLDALNRHLEAVPGF